MVFLRMFVCPETDSTFQSLDWVGSFTLWTINVAVVSEALSLNPVILPQSWDFLPEHVCLLFGFKKMLPGASEPMT